MELTIKELAAYLPYGLKYQKISKGNFKSDEDIIEIKNWVINDIEDLLKLRYKVKSVKPILYPLDYLTKEITHNGETFKTIEWLEDKYYTLNYRQQCVRLLDEDGHDWINQTDYMLVKQLLEWKLDIFNLIENNLAIPVTEDFNPYK